MNRLVALALVAMAAACGDFDGPSRLDLIKERAAQQREKDVIPPPAIRHPEDIGFTGMGKRDPFHPR